MTTRKFEWLFCGLYIIFILDSAIILGGGVCGGSGFFFSGVEKKTAHWVLGAFEF